MPLFLLTVGGVFTKQLSARWAIVQLAGRRILVPLIVVQVHVAQPTRTQTSPSSSRPRTAAFHAVNSGSNPLGDANRHQRLSFFLLPSRKAACRYNTTILLLRRQRISRTHRGLFCRLFLYRKGSAVKPSPCVATHPGKPAIRRPRPNIPLCLARCLDPPNVRASLQARASRPSTASGHSLVPPLPRSNALLRRHAPKPETALYHGRCTAPVRSCPHPPVLISCQ